MHFEQYRPKLGIFCLRRTAVNGFGKGDAQLLRDQPDRFRKSDVLDFLDEGENVTLGGTSETIKKLARGVNRKRRRLLAVKWTKPGKILRAGFSQFDVVAHDADDVRLLFNGFFKISGFGHQE